MKYRIEIWQYHFKSDSFESVSPKEIVEWYDDNWKEVYETGGCSYTISIDDVELNMKDRFEFIEKYRKGYGEYYEYE